MTTENNNPEANPEADNEAPPVAHVFGRAVSEWVTYTFIAFVIIAVIFGSIVGSERDAQAERAMATLAALTEAAANKAATGADLVCDETLLNAELLANDYLTLSVRSAPINEEDKSLGYGPALYVSVVEKKVSGDTWDTAKRLMDLVKEAGEEASEKEAALSEDRTSETNITPPEDDLDESASNKKPKNRLREVRKKSYGETEEYLQYHILASEDVLCSQDV